MSAAPSMFSAGSVLLTASGAVGSAGAPTRVYYANIISGATASVLSLLDGGSAGTTWAKVSGTASTGVGFEFGTYGLLFPDGLYVSLDANAVSVAIAFSQ